MIDRMISQQSQHLYLAAVTDLPLIFLSQVAHPQPSLSMCDTRPFYF